MYDKYCRGRGEEGFGREIAAVRTGGGIPVLVPRTFSALLFDPLLSIIDAFNRELSVNVNVGVFKYTVPYL